MAKRDLSGPVRLTDYIVPVLCFVASWAIGAWFYSQMPAQVPVHWGLNGEADRMGSRFEGAFTPAIAYTLLLVLFVFLSRMRAGRLMLASAGVLGLFMIAIQTVIGLNSIGVLLDVSKLVMLCMAALFVALGFIVPLMPQNRFGGFRNSYTLSDMRVWESTNKLGGRMLLLCGILIVPLAFAPPMAGFIGIFTVIIITIVFVPWLHSMREYRRLKTQH